MVSWRAPTANEDGSAVSLSGFRVRYGLSASNLDQSVTVSGSSTTSYALDGLASGTWYFMVTALSMDGTESAPSNVASKAVN